MRINSKHAYISLLRIYLIALPLGAINIGLFGSALRLLAILPIGLAALNMYHFYRNKMVSRYFIYTLIAFASIAYSVNPSESTEKATSFLLLLLLLASICCFSYSNNDISILKKSLIWSSRISAVVCLLFAKYVQGRLWLTGNGVISEDPNYFCLYLSFGFINVIQSMLKEKSVLKKTVLVLEGFVYLLICLLSGSRGGVIAIVIGAFTFIAFSNSSDKLSYKKILTLSFLAIGIYIGISFLSDSIAQRFTLSSVTDSGATGRIELWLQAFDLFGKSPLYRKLFGYGISSTVTCFSTFGYHRVNVMHNMFIESLLEIGIVGLIIYVSMVFTFLANAYKLRDRFAFGVLCCMVIMSLSTSISAFKPYINCMLFIIASCNCFKQDDYPTDQNKKELGAYL